MKSILYRIIELCFMKKLVLYKYHFFMSCNNSHVLKLFHHTIELNIVHYFIATVIATRDQSFSRPIVPRGSRITSVASISAVITTRQNFLGRVQRSYCCFRFDAYAIVDGRSHRNRL